MSGRVGARPDSLGAGIFKARGADTLRKGYATLRNEGPERNLGSFDPSWVYPSLRSPSAYSLPSTSHCAGVERARRVPFGGLLGDNDRGMNEYQNLDGRDRFPSLSDNSGLVPVVPIGGFPELERTNPQTAADRSPSVPLVPLVLYGGSVMRRPSAPARPSAHISLYRRTWNEWNERGVPYRPLSVISFQSLFANWNGTPEEVDDE